MKRWLKWAVAIVAALLVALVWVPVPLRLDIAMPAVEVRHGDACTTTHGIGTG